VARRTADGSVPVWRRTDPSFGPSARHLLVRPFCNSCLYREYCMLSFAVLMILLLIQDTSHARHLKPQKVDLECSDTSGLGLVSRTSQSTAEVSSAFWRCQTFHTVDFLYWYHHWTARSALCILWWDCIVWYLLGKGVFISKTGELYDNELNEPKKKFTVCNYLHVLSIIKQNSVKRLRS